MPSYPKWYCTHYITLHYNALRPHILQTQEARLGSSPLLPLARCCTAITIIILIIITTITITNIIIIITMDTQAANGLFLLKPPMHHFDSIVKFCRNCFWCKWAFICRRVPHHLPMTQTQILFENWQLNSMMCQNLYKKCLFSEIRKALIFIFSVASLTFNTLFTKVVEYWILHIGENFIQQTGQWQD